MNTNGHRFWAIPDPVKVNEEDLSEGNHQSEDIQPIVSCDKKVTQQNNVFTN